MALGTPVVACTTATTPDILANGITGIAVDNNPEAFANALVGMLPDREWREMLGSGASVRIRKMCSIAQVLRQTIDAHQDALSGEARRLAA
jgi:glycosyltransferase involved in cell wall biosynthesis